MASEKLSADARYYEYMSAADPDVSPIPFAVFPPSLHTREASCNCPPHACSTCPCASACTRADAGNSAVIPLDLSQALGTAWPCTSPALLACFISLAPTGSETPSADATDVQRHVALSSNASSHMFYVIRGEGSTVAHLADGAVVNVAWATGDLFTFPAVSRIAHVASHSAVLYSLNDAPLLAYLNAAPKRDVASVTPTVYRSRDMTQALRDAVALGDAAVRNRNGVLLGHAATEDSTKTLTPTLWALYNALPAGVTQRAHKHASVAVDLCVAAGADTETVMAHAVDATGELLPPLRRAAWVAGGVFVTPPNVWHSHVNGSGVDAIVLPTQDAGLHTFLRTLNITFAPVKQPVPAAEAAAC